MKTAIHHPALPPESLLRAFVLIAFLILATACATAEAAVSNCSGGNPANWSVGRRWTLTPQAGALKNGDQVAIQEGTLILNYTVTGTDTLYVQGNFPNNYQFNLDQRATVLPTVPGLGMRVTLELVTLFPGGVMGTQGDGIIRPGGSTLSTTPVTAGTYRAELKFKFEMIVINVEVYRGGTLGFVDGLVALGIHFQSDLSGARCNLRPIDNPVVSLPGSTPPVLPPPPAPTCTFTTETLNQSVRLNPVATSMVAPNQSSRERGAAGEKPFSINATNCSKDARFRIYFTDNSNQGNTGQTLGQTASSASRNQVGIRLYYDNQTAPFNFGPAPTGATAGTNYVEISAGGTAGVSVAAPFTAQYVMNPGISQAQVTGGHIEAEAVVTIVYP